MSNGDTTLDGIFGLYCVSWDASTINANGVNKKCTSSGAFGSCIWAFNFA